MISIYKYQYDASYSEMRTKIIVLILQIPCSQDSCVSESGGTPPSARSSTLTLAPPR